LQLPGAGGRVDVEAELGRARTQRVRVADLRGVETRVLREQRLLELEQLEALAELVALALVFDRRRAEHLPRGFADHRLSQRDHVPIVRVRLVELEHRELGIVARRQALVAEHAVQLVHALEPYRDGTTHVIFEPEDFIARLAALVPKPRAHQIRYHGVFAPASPDRARVVPRTRAAVAGECGEASVTDRQRALALTWAQRLKRVFAIEIETCRRCGGRLRVIA